MSQPFDSLVLSGGGIKGFLHLGALAYYSDIGLLVPEHIVEYAGTSIGSVIAFLLICGYKPMELFQKLYEKGIFTEVETSLLNVYQTMGVVSFEPFINFLYVLLDEKEIDRDITFKLLYEKNEKLLHISGVNLTEMCEECFNVLNTPDMRVIDAIHISCNLPVIFQRFKYNSSYYVDGGVLNHYPHNYISKSRERCLGLLIDSTGSQTLPEETIIGYLYRIFRLVISSAINSDVPDHITTIHLSDKSTDTFRLDLPSSIKMELFTDGYRTAESKQLSRLIDVKGW